MSGGGAERAAHETGILLEAVVTGLFLIVTRGVFLGEVTVVLGLDLAAFVFGDVAAGENPLPTKGWKSVLNIPGEGGIPPGTASVVKANRFVDFDPSVGMFCLGESDLPQGHLQVGKARALDINPSAVGKDVGDGAGFAGGGGFVRCDHIGKKFRRRRRRTPEGVRDAEKPTLRLNKKPLFS